LWILGNTRVYIGFPQGTSLVGEGSNLPNIPYSGDDILILLPFRTGGCSTNHFNIIMASGGSKQDEPYSLHLILA
jgi:hypothetical protein